VRYYLGVDWADQTHAVWVMEERGTKITARTVPHPAEGLSEWGREPGRVAGAGDRAVGGD
jgi:hypothetical protein